MNKTVIIYTEALTKTYQMEAVAVQALRAVSFEIQSGEFTALMGTSGSGKSTLMHLLGCLDTPTSGRYFLNNIDVSDLSSDQQAQIRNQHIGFIFQTFNLLTRLTALENVTLPLLYRGASALATQKATDALDQVGLADRMNHRPSELSGGQRQRVAIARALVTNPAVILADEPTGNLDSTTGTEIMGLLKTLHRDKRTIVMVTHDAQVAAHADRILYMQDGRLVDQGQSTT